MKVTDRLKQVVFKQLYKELGNAEIIPYEDSIWFINREEKYWYFEFENAGTLYWRYGFFPSFFTIFSLEREDFEPILASWVEEVLNHKVSTTTNPSNVSVGVVEEVLNHRVSSTLVSMTTNTQEVEEVLNNKVSTTCAFRHTTSSKLGEVLNHKVSTTQRMERDLRVLLGEVLNHKVLRTGGTELPVFEGVEEVLNHKSFTKIDGVWRGDDLVEEILNENPTE